MSAGSQTNFEDRGRAYYVLAVLVVVYAVNFIDRNILTVLLQPIKEEFGVSDFAMGLLTGPAFALFYTFAGIPIARIADRGSRVTVMAVGVAFWSLMTAASGLAKSFAWLAAARVGVGVGEASATPSAHSLISDYFPVEWRTRAIALYNGGASLGILFGLLLGGVLAETLGWRNTLIAVGLPGVLLAVLVRVTVSEPPRGASEGRVDSGEVPGFLETFGYLMRLPTFRHVAWAAALYSLSAYGLFNWAPTFMRRVHELSYAEVGLQLGLAIGIGGAVGQFVGADLCDRLAKRDRRWLVWVPALLGVGLAPFLAAFALAGDPSFALLAFVPVCLVNAVYAAPSYTIVQGLASLRMRATASAIMLFVLNLIGLGLGPPLVGAMNDWLEPTYGADAIRYSLLALLVANLWGAAHSAWAARSVERELAAAEARS